MPRLATYLIPDPDSAFYRVGCTVLGYDIFAECDVPLPDSLRHRTAEIRPWVGHAHQYGFHATIGDALIFPDDAAEEIESRLKLFAGSIPPFVLTNGRIHDSFRAFPRTLVATFDNPDGTLKQLEERVVTEINVLHAGSPVFGPHAASLTGLRREQLEQFGSPDVRSLFDLHFSLATSLPDAESRACLRDLVLTELGLFSTSDQHTLAVDRIYLLEQRPNGRFTIRRTYRLTES